MHTKGSWRNVSQEEGDALKGKGFLAMDPHVHSSHSYDVPDASRTAPERIVEEQARQGLLKVLTDHDVMTAHDTLARDDVIKGVEIKVRPARARLVKDAGPLHTVHLNVYDLDQRQFGDIQGMSGKAADLDELVDYLRAERLPYQYNHPFWHERHEPMNWKAVPDLARQYFDVIELNAGRPKRLNDLASYLAQEYGKGITASTDSHTGRPGWAYTLAKGANFREFWESIRQGQMLVVRQDMTALGIVEEATRMIENIFEEKQHKRQFRPGTGVPMIDNIALRLYKTQTSEMVRKVAYRGLQFVNSSFGKTLADRLYIDKEDAWGKSITEEVIGIVSASIMAGRLSTGYH